MHRRSTPELDRRTPVLLVKVGRYPLAHGPLGAVRSLGRAGVPVYAMVEDGFTPTAVSRYLAGSFVRPITGCEPPERLVETIRGVGRDLANRVGRRCVAVPTDDEAAVVLGEHAAELDPYLLLPRVPAGLPRQVADKGSLHELCRAHGVPAPVAVAAHDRDELLRGAAECGYPLVLKNLAPFTRLSRPVVGHTTVVRDETELLAGCPPDDGFSVLVQEYLAGDFSEHWITHLCCGPDGDPLVVFSGRKLRSFPPTGGFTTRAVSETNSQLAKLAGEFCRRIGYSGIADLDWRLDLRDGRYKLLDFNPRAGAQFRLFETVDGVDVVRALHLSLTGRPVHGGPQLTRYYGVGQLDLISAAVAIWNDHRLPSDLRPRRSTERAWLCHDDLLPAGVLAARFGAQATRRAAGSIRFPAAARRFLGGTT
ncbi:ATP-grasp domain-containing protein [Kitasatospora sp. NPDC048365]|uniref:carboxylate--amine ligase n=1 Tax=Kitasatospora sp. NPDC048365 TaxID=3364050 RepID=UPI00371F1D85